MPASARRRAAAESPQWRRGPAAKPMLCNACGTRYRRTGQLGSPSALASRPAACAKPAARPHALADSGCSAPFQAFVAKKPRLEDAVRC